MPKLNYQIPPLANKMIEDHQAMYKALYDEHVSKQMVLNIFIIWGKRSIDARLADMENQLIEHNKKKDEKNI